MSDARLTLQLE
jgi:hypothetical protein